MNPLHKVIDDQLAEAAKTTPEGEFVAVTCQIVLRFSGPVIGALRAHPTHHGHGLYQILAPAQTPERKPTMVEITFHIDEVVAFGIQREPSSISTPRGAGKIFTPQ